MFWPSGHPDTKTSIPAPSGVVFFQFHLEERWGMDVQTWRHISRLKIDVKSYGVSIDDLE